MSLKFAIFLQRSCFSRFLNASVTVRGASPTLVAISCGYIGPVSAKVSRITIELLVRFIGRRIGITVLFWKPNHWLLMS